MNEMPNDFRIEPDPTEGKAIDITAEQLIVGALLMDHRRVATVRARLLPADFVEPFHAQVVTLLGQFLDEGRKPSIETIVAAYDNAELYPGMSVRTYLGKLIQGAFVEAMTPTAFNDAVELVQDRARRRALAGVGNLLIHAGEDRPTADIVQQAIANLDDVLVMLRGSKRLTYTAGGAGDIAMHHLATEDRKYPTTGLADLDKVTGGFPLGQLTLIAGRPGMGKSAVMSSMALRTARSGNPVGIFSLEMVGEQLGSRMLCDLAFTADTPIMYEDILNRRIDANQLRRLERANGELKQLPVQIEEQRGLTYAEIAARARKMAANFERSGHPLRVLFVDHLGLIRPSGRYQGNRNNEIGEISDGLASLAKELDCAVVALSQLNREVERRGDKRPQLADLRDSGTLEQDASLIIFGYREAYYLERQKHADHDKEVARLDKLDRCKNTLELGVAKNRNGRVENVDVFVNIGANAVRNMSFDF